MALQFVFGNSLSTRSTATYSAVCREAKATRQVNYIFLVPEQATLFVQRELVRLHPDHVLGNIDVLSFGRLAHRVLAETGGMAPLLDDTGKSMVLHRVAKRTAPELELLGPGLKQNGFIAALKSVISEFAAYRVTDEALLAACGSVGNTRLSGKLKDLECIYRAFREEMGETYVTAEELLSVLAKRIPASALLKDAVVILDGYTGFTPLQYAVLEALLVRCRLLICGVTADEETFRFLFGGGSPAVRAELFAMGTEMARQLLSLAEKNGVRAGGHRFIAEERPVARETRALERNLYRYPLLPCPGLEGGLRLVAADNPGEELDFVLREVLLQVRSGHCRYRDMAVVAGDLSLYAREAEEKLKALGIPYFLDRKKPLMGNPLISLIRLGLEAIFGDMRYDAVVGFLKNPLTGLPQRELDELDNYLLAGGIQGFRRWQSPWLFPFGRLDEQALPGLNLLREQILSWFLPLREAWTDREASVREKMTALYRFLLLFSPAEKLEEKRHAFAQAGEHYLESEYAQVYGKVMGLFDQTVELMGGQVVEGELLADMLNSGFAELNCGFLPASADRLVIGDLTRTRLEQVKILFVIGANDRVLPKAAERGGLITDYERELLREHGLALADPAREEAFRQQYYLYLLLTRPGEKLVLTRSLTGKDGKALRRSQVLSQLERIFPGIREEKAKEAFPGLARLVGREDGLDELAVLLRRALDAPGEEPHWRDLYTSYAADPARAETLAALREALFTAYKAEKLDAVIARRLFGGGGTMPVTRLEQYAACAYRHFLDHGLRLKKRSEADLAAADYGTLFHASISTFFACLSEKGLTLDAVSEEERQALVEESVRSAMAEFRTDVFDRNARNRSMAGRIRRMTQRTLWALSRQWEQGAFTQTLHEMDFGGRGDDLLKLPLAHSSIALRGRVDRLDLAEEDGRLYAKIIDYKSGGTHVDTAKILHGLQLQLVLYLDAVTALLQRQHPGLSVVPAGMYYYNLKDPIVEGDFAGGEEVAAAQLKALRMNGLTSERAARLIDRSGGQVVQGLDYRKDGTPRSSALLVAEDDLRAIGRFGRKKAAELAEGMLSGQIPLNPYRYRQETACTFCEYRGVCGFDPQVEGCRYRGLAGNDSEKVMEKLTGKTGEEHGD